MGQTPPKYFLPSAPYGASEAANAVNPVQSAAVNPQTPLLPPNFQDPGQMNQVAGQTAPKQGPVIPGKLPHQQLRTTNYGDMLKGLFGALLFALLAFPVWATTTVTGKIQNLGTGNMTNGAFVRFWLRGCGGNQPRVNGTAVIGPSQGGVYFFDIAADASGNISGTIYSTRDNTGNGNGDIECGGSKLAVWYGMQIFVAGKGGPEIPIHAKSGVTLDITQAVPITSNPVVTSPTGDSTYLRLDAGNSPVLGNLGISGALTVGQVNKVIAVDGTQYATLAAAVAACPSGGATVWVPDGTNPTLVSVLTISNPCHIIFGKNTITCTMADPGTSSGCINITSDNVEIEGQGPLSSITQGVANIQTAIFFGAHKNIRIHGIKIDWNDANQTVTGGFYAGIRSAAGSADIRIYDSEFTRGGDRAIDIRGANRVWIRHNYFHQTGLAGVAGQPARGGSAISVDVDGSTHSTDGYCENNQFEEWGDTAIKCGNDRVHINFNTLRGRADFGNTPLAVESGIDMLGTASGEAHGNQLRNVSNDVFDASAFNNGVQTLVTSNIEVIGNTFYVDQSSVASSDPRVVVSQAGLAVQLQRVVFSGNNFVGVRAGFAGVDGLIFSLNNFKDLITNAVNYAVDINQVTGGQMKNFSFSLNTFTTSNATLVTAFNLNASSGTWAPATSSFTDNSVDASVTNRIVYQAAANVKVPELWPLTAGVVQSANGLSTTTLSASGQITSTLSTGTAPIVAASTTPVANLTVQNIDPTQTYRGKRLYVGGTALVAGDFALGGNWGTSPGALIPNNNATDQAGSVTIPSGSGSPGANPTITLTFHDGTWTLTPQCLGLRADISNPSTAIWMRTAISATAITFTFLGTPAASTNYVLEWICLGH